MPRMEPPGYLDLNINYQMENKLSEGAGMLLTLLAKVQTEGTKSLEE